MEAFFRNTLQSPLDGNISDTPPVIVVPRKEDLARWKQIGEEAEDLKARKDKVRAQAEIEFSKWLSEEGRPKMIGPTDPADEIAAVSAANGVDINFKNRPLDVTLPADITTGDGHLTGRKALYFKGKGSLELPNVELFEARRPFTIAAWVKIPKTNEDYVVVSQTDPASRYRGWALELNAGVPVLRFTLYPAKTISFRGRLEDRPAAGWNHITFTYDGTGHVSGLALFVNARVDEKEFRGDFRNFAPLRIGSDGKRRYFEGGAISDLRLFARTLGEEEVQIAASWPLLDSLRSIPESELTPSDKDALRLFFLNGRRSRAGEQSHTSSTNERIESRSRTS
jgi:hypothetical protein